MRSRRRTLLRGPTHEPVYTRSALSHTSITNHDSVIEQKSYAFSKSHACTCTRTHNSTCTEFSRRSVTNVSCITSRTLSRGNTRTQASKQARTHTRETLLDNTAMWTGTDGQKHLHVLYYTLMPKHLITSLQNMHARTRTRKHPASLAMKRSRNQID